MQWIYYLYCTKNYQKYVGFQNQFSLVHLVMFNSLQPHGLQHTRLPGPSSTPGGLLTLMSIELVTPSNHLILCHPLILLPPIPPASEPFSMSHFIAWSGQSTGVSASASFLPKKFQGWSPSDGLVESPCSPRDSQESSPTPQLKSINSSVLSFLHSPTLTSIHDYWKNHSLD